MIRKFSQRRNHCRWTLKDKQIWYVCVCYVEKGRAGRGEIVRHSWQKEWLKERQEDGFIFAVWRNRESSQVA